MELTWLLQSLGKVIGDKAIFYVVLLYPQVPFQDLATVKWAPYPSSL